MVHLRTLALFACALLTITALAGCTTPAPTEPASATFTATEYSFEGPDTLEAGLTELELINAGQEPHHLQVVRLEAGHTYQELIEALQAGGPALPSWAHEVGGPNAGFPGQLSGPTTALVDLEPGTYALLCTIPDGQGTPHVAHGMAKELTVTGDQAPDLEPPEPDVTVQLVDFSFEMTGTPEAGEQVFQVENLGGQPHELVLVKLQPNATVEEVAAAFGPNGSGQPPAVFVGGIVGIEAGTSQTFTATLEPGEYGLICFLPDLEDAEHGHPPHLAKGMMDQFTVAG